WAGRRRAVAMRFFYLELARGNHEHIREELTRMFHAYQTDENLTAQLMATLHRCGRGPQAADIYEDHRDALARQTAREASRTLRRLLEAIADHDEEKIATLFPKVVPAAGSLADRVAPRPHHELPRNQELVGRDSTLAELTWLLAPQPDRPPRIIIIV